MGWAEQSGVAPARGDPVAATGAAQFAVAARLTVAAWASCALLQIFLYARPGPYGGAFLLEWKRYFGLALYYELLGVWLLALPFFIAWLMLYRRRIRQSAATTVHTLHAAVLTANLALSQLDHELLRFLGTRLGLSFLATYGRPETLSDSLFMDVLSADAGGPFLGLLLLAALPAAYFWWARRLIRRDGRGRLHIWIALMVAVFPLVAPANAWLQATGKFRLRKVEPVVLALATDFALGYDDLGEPADLPRLVRDYRRGWLMQSADSGWAFPDPRYPYWRVPSGPAPAPRGRPWNIIYLQLETLRGVDMSPRATPYLDSLARSGQAAAWTRALSFGQPSINGLFAAHCSITPHSRRYVTAFPHVRFDCLPDLLRRHGYRAEMFNAGDTDWDNATYWLARWYDRLWRFPEAKEHDRPVFRAAAMRIRRMAASGRPFLASVVSVSNHTPFLSKEPGFDIAGQATPNERILNTTRYTDDVVREFMESLRREPWFEHTLVIIVGDHGFNLGEHDGRPGQLNLYRESMWVPLIVAGAHPRLPVGAHDQLASMLDIAPTLADLLGLREANAWQGHSLLAKRRSSLTFVNRDAALAETEMWSALNDSVTGRERLFESRGDWLQRRDLGARDPARAAALLRIAKERRLLNDYLLRKGRIRPD